MSLTSACSAEPSLAVQTVPYWAIVEPSNALAAVTESGRLRLLTSLLETTATTIINKDNAILGGGSVDDAAIRAAAQEYGTALCPQLLPVAVAVAFALIMWPIIPPVISGIFCTFGMLCLFCMLHYLDFFQVGRGS